MKDDKGFQMIGPHDLKNEHFFHKGEDNFYETKKYLSKMFDYYSIGMCNTIAYASPRTGDTVGSFMIGGLRTVMNGDWEVHAGDLLQWYWTFERECFRKDGTRKSYRSFDENENLKVDAFGMSLFKDLKEDVDPTTGRLLAEREGAEPSAKKTKLDHNEAQAKKRGNFADRQYGIKPNRSRPAKSPRASRASSGT
jgi:hypothetical protein